MFCKHLKYGCLLAIFSCKVVAIDLLAVYGLAEENDPVYRQVVSATLAAQESRPQAKASLLPSININLSSASNRQNNEGGFVQPGNENTRFNSHGYSLDLKQPLFRWDRYLALQQTTSIIQQAEAEKILAQQALIMRVAENYFALLAAADDLELAKAEKKSLTKQLKQTKQQFAAGLTAITNVQEIQAGFDRAVSDHILNKNLLDNARENMSAITAHYTTEFSILNPELTLVRPQPDNIEQWSQIAEQQNIDVIIAKYKVEYAAQEIDKRNAANLPVLDLVANYGNNISGGRFGRNDTTSTQFSLQFNLPLYQGGMISSRTKEARHLYDQSLQQMTQFLRLARRDSRQAYLSVLSGISRVQALKQAVTSSEVALQATKTGFSVGTRTAVDVVASERNLLNARSQYLQAKYDYLIDGLRLKKAAGSLNPDDLKQLNNWLVDAT